MAIQVRRGNESDFNASKMLPGEWAVSLDTKYVRMCFAPGVVLRMATYEGFEADKAQIQAILAECRSIQSAVQRIQADVNSKASLVVEYSNNAKTSADKAHSEAERAKIYADNAEAVTGVQIATKERAGLIKGGDNYIEEDGTLMLITTTDSTTQPNSYAGRENILEIGGVTEQDSTAGNQLFDKSNINVGLGVSTADGSLYSDSNMFSTDYIDVSNLNSIAWNGLSSPTGTWGAFYDENKIFVGALGTNVFTSNIPSGAYYVRLSFLNQYLDTAMVNAGTTALPYEPYTGGIPAPNPSYPMEIKKSVVSGVKTYSGRNLAVIATNGFNAVIGYVKKGVDYTVCFEQDAEMGFNVVITDFGPATIANYTSNGTKAIATFTADADGSLLINNWDNKNPRNYMLVEGTYTEFIPFEEPEISYYTFSQPIELYGMGGVQDVITPNGINRRYKSVTNRSFSVINGYDVGGSKLMVAQIEDKAPESWSYNLYHSLCTKLPAKNMLSLDEDGFYLFNYAIYARIAGCSDVNEFNAKMPDAVFVYELAEETTEELPIADQIGLNSLATYDGITYVEFDSEIQPTFKAEYGTSKVGGYTLEGMLAGRNGELYGKDYNSRLSALELSVVNNI